MEKIIYVTDWSKKTIHSRSNSERNDTKLKTNKSCSSRSAYILTRVQMLIRAKSTQA